jgi:hypothetical protein
MQTGGTLTSGLEFEGQAAKRRATIVTAMDEEAGVYLIGSPQVCIT